MESSSAMRRVPPRKKLRDGQQQVVDMFLGMMSGTLPCQLPTGYGKTLVAVWCFVQKYFAGEVNRLLYVVSSASQLEQFLVDGKGDFVDAGLEGVKVCDIGYSPALALKEHKKNTKAVFVCTVQALATSASVSTAVKEMMSTGKWMVVPDEHHHYGTDKSWTNALFALPANFTLAMSATPNRRNNDSAFGEPKVRVTYAKARGELAVKSLRLHAYEYKVDAITVNGDPVSFTTTELAQEAGSTDPNAIDKYIVEKKLRWSPKYISPLVSIPVERLLRTRGGLPLQMIVGAMGCLHAKMVCEQIKSMFGDLLRIDWVGTGPHGRTDEENRSIIAKFCPPKKDGKRDPKDVKLDVLVHVGMAGEGLDSVFVTEVVHLNPAGLSNKKDQENGRAARRIPGAPESMQVAHINVDSSSPYAQWSGSKIEHAFDREHDDDIPDESDDDRESRDPSELPDEPLVIIADCELQNIDKGDPEVRDMAICIGKSVNEMQPGAFDWAQLENKEHPIWDRALEYRRRELEERSRGMNDESTMAQLRQSINSATGAVSALAARTMSSGRFERSLVGDVKKRIYTEMKKRFGHAIDMADESELRERYRWLKELERNIRSTGAPQWLR